MKVNVHSWIQKLGVLLAVQLVVLAVMWWPKGSSTVVHKDFFDPNLSLGDLQKITVSDGSNNLTLAKKNDAWVVLEESEFPADPEKMETMISDMKKAQAGLPVGRTKTAHSRFEVTDQKFQRKVSFFKSAGEEPDFGFYLGSSPQFRQNHIRKFEDKNVYVSAELKAFNLSAESKDWINKRYMNIDAENLVAIHIQRGREQLKFEKTETAVALNPGDAVEPVTQPAETVKVWTLNGRPVNTAKFDAIVRNLSKLRLSSVLGTEDKPEFGLQKPKATVKLVYAEGTETREKTLVLGAAQENQYVAKKSDSPFYVHVGAYQIKSVLETPKKELLAAAK